MTNISLYKNAKDTDSQDTIPFDIFLDYIRDGKWEDEANSVRLLKTKEERADAKKKLPNVTISGVFTERRDSEIDSHSGFVAIDVDDMNPNKVKDILSLDEYVYAIFMSVSGTGACVVFKINGDKHREAFKGIQEYLFKTYEMVIDPTCINPSRARFVSYDPDIRINEKAKKFAKYPKERQIKKIDTFIYSDHDFDNVMYEIRSRRMNLCENYHDWLRIGFALADKFGEAGRSAFHEISQYSSKYDGRQCDRQYDNCIKGNGDGITISTFFYYCKEAGLPIYSEQTKTIIGAATNSKRSGQSIEDAVRKLEKFEGIDESISKGIVEQVFKSPVEIKTGDSIIHRLEAWLRQDYDLRRNVITRHIDMNGKTLDQVKRNDLYMEANKLFDNVSYEMLDRVINSSNTVDYNPIQEFIMDNQELRQDGLIERLMDTIEVDPASGATREYVHSIGTKWLVSLMASVFGEHSPMMLVLAGGQNTGKTEWFRRLLPDRLKSFFGEMQQGMKENDEAIMMTQKLIVLDDEMAGKSKKEENNLKSMLSKQIFTLREPYGRHNVDLVRIAVMCGTTNHIEILTDPTGNRRFLPIHVKSINHEAYNAIDKDELFMEIYRLYKSGYKWRLEAGDIELLTESSREFQSYSSEAELISEYMEVPVSDRDPRVRHMMTTGIKAFLEKLSGQRISSQKLGLELKAAGFEQKNVKIDKQSRRCYSVILKVNIPNGTDMPEESRAAF